MSLVASGFVVVVSCILLIWVFLDHLTLRCNRTAEQVSHDIRFEFPDQKCYGRIAARSGLAANHSLIVLGGVVDNDYW